ncbi:P-loop containing nucleoside triphosphate hydrolase protein [Hypoxylon sp. FL1284]|nr:P-loop containing nucleoside triphosphate hydrolase protein [Hypoxylon sp. FL1284]
MRLLLRTASASSRCAASASRSHAFSTSSVTSRDIGIYKRKASSPRPSSGPPPRPPSRFPPRPSSRYPPRPSSGSPPRPSSRSLVYNNLNNLGGSQGDNGSPKRGQRGPSQRDTEHTYAMFRNLVLARFDMTLKPEQAWKEKEDEYRAFGVHSKLDLDREVKLFRGTIVTACDLASEKQAVSKDANPLFWGLRNAFIEREMQGLSEEIVFSFRNFLTRSKFPKSIAATHQKIADFRYPHEWYPATRALQRTVHLHVGPTNSGKTFNALKALEDAKTGIYAGPLRLLAHEVYSRFLAKGRKCALITGEEMRVPENEDIYFRSCTVEMTPLNTLVDVAVIDEIQMLGDSERGWAWTQAFLGVQAKEVHVCGEERAVELIKSLCAATGDKYVINRYKRLSPLECMTEGLHGDWRNLQKGDAVISFSRIGIHAIKKQIEQMTRRRCAMVYGSLPPETRAQQAALFNDPDNEWDYLVASDAVGMGLNLEIKRVVFEQTHKRSSAGYRAMTTSEIKQIGGRAGRFRTARQAAESESAPNAVEQGVDGTPKTGQPGLVTTMDDDDLDLVRDAFSREPEPLTSAGIQPPSAVVERFSSYFPPNTPFSYIIARLRDIAQISSNYHLCNMGEMYRVADLIQPFAMSVYDRCVFLNAPVFLREVSGAEVLQAFARCVATMERGDLVDLPEVELELLNKDESDYFSDTSERLRELENLHKSITLYLWLSYRYSGVFCSQNLAFHVKALVEARIDYYLSNVKTADMEKRRALARKAAKKNKRKMRRLVGEYKADDRGHEIPGKWDEEGHEEPLYEDNEELNQITRLEKDGQTPRYGQSRARTS